MKSREPARCMDVATASRDGDGVLICFASTAGEMETLSIAPRAALSLARDILAALAIIEHVRHVDALTTESRAPRAID